MLVCFKNKAHGIVQAKEHTIGLPSGAVLRLSFGQCSISDQAVVDEAVSTGLFESFVEDASSASILVAVEPIEAVGEAVAVSSMAFVASEKRPFLTEDVPVEDVAVDGVVIGASSSSSNDGGGEDVPPEGLPKPRLGRRRGH